MDFKALLALTLLLVVVVRLALIICCTSKIPGEQHVKSGDQDVKSESFSSRNWSRLLAKSLRAIGVVRTTDLAHDRLLTSLGSMFHFWSCLVVSQCFGHFSYGMLRLSELQNMD
jgi:hypothetical protein